MQNKKKKKIRKKNLQDDNTKTKTCFYFNIIYKKSWEYFKRTKNKKSICKEDEKT